jgi:fumarate reductase subunit C
MNLPTDKRELKEKLRDMTSDDLFRWVGWVIAFAAIVLLSVFVTYITFFGGKSISDDPEAWGQFGDFIGGTANPVLSFLTLIALALTIILQSRQLSISSRELELTRDELRRSAKAQELSEEALRAQADAAHRSAQLESINLLLGHTQTEMRELIRIGYAPDDIRHKRILELKEKESVLLAKLDEFFVELTRGVMPVPELRT